MICFRRCVLLSRVCKSFCRQYNPELDVWKFLFALLIVFSHGIFLANTENGDRLIFGHALVGVEFFLGLSGYFLMQSIYSRDYDTLSFIKGKVFRLLPYWIPSFIFCAVIWMLLYILERHPGKWEILSISLMSFYDFIGFSASGIGTIRINGTWWYISAMLFAEWLLYPIIRKYEKIYVSYFLPLSIFLLVGFMSCSYGTLAAGKLAGFVNSDVLRAILGIEVGTLAFYLSEMIKNQKWRKINKYATQLVKYICLLLIFIIAYKNTTTISVYVNNQMDFVVLYLVLFAISLMCSKNTPPHDTSGEYKNTKTLGKLSTCIYLVHWHCMEIIRYIMPDYTYPTKLIILFLLSGLVAYIVMLIGDYVISPVLQKVK